MNIKTLIFLSLLISNYLFSEDRFNLKIKNLSHQQYQTLIKFLESDECKKILKSKDFKLKYDLKLKQLKNVQKTNNNREDLVLLSLLYEMVALPFKIMLLPILLPLKLMILPFEIILYPFRDLFRLASC